MNQPPSHPSPSSSHHRRPVYLTVHGPVSYLTSRVRFRALLAVVGSAVLFTTVVTPWRSVLDSCSMLASVPLAPVVGSFSLLPSHSFAFTGNDGPSPSSPFEVGPFTFKLYGSNSPSVGAGSLLLQNLAFHGPALNLRSHNFKTSLCNFAHIHLHSSIVQLVAHHLHSALPFDLLEFCWPSLRLLCFVSLSTLLFTPWLSYIGIPSFEDTPLDAEERWPIPDLHRKLIDRKSTRLNSSHSGESRMPSSA